MATTFHPPAAWLALGVRSESEKPHEWPALASVILSRVADRRWPDTIWGVLLEPLQFSGFNDTYGDPDDRYAQVAVQYPQAQKDLAHACAEWMLGVPAGDRPLGPRVCWFWSPRSMKPAGKTPGWASRLRTVVVPGIDPWRFLFGEEQ